ncbi:MAG: Berberine and berberine like, partial [Pseudonocardiales bacterium]|nr:Berberine and berberine like [Pseudonocardiales bacterium]
SSSLCTRSVRSSTSACFSSARTTVAICSDSPAFIAPIPQALDPVVSMVTPIAYAAPQQMFDESAPCTGSYVNFMTDHDAERVRNAYGDKYRRLQQIKATYDPDSTSTRI